MIRYLVSDLGTSEKVDGVRVACKAVYQNGLIELLKKDIKKFDTLVFVASNPTGYEKTDNYAEMTFEGLKLSGIEFKNLIVLDERNKTKAKQLVEKADLLFLAGGHVPTQNDFFADIRLAEIIKNCHGVVMGQSAGAMNMASNVYNYPEDESELQDPKFLKGLGLTDISVIPHFDKKKGNVQVEDGIDLLNDFYLKDSFVMPLIAIPNGSFVRIDEKGSKVYGEAYKFENGKMTEITSASKNKSKTF